MSKIQKLYQKGFTVVELLIVIVVIGILAALVLNSFAGVQAKARDTQRQTDINAVATQLEACYNDRCNGAYPTLAALQDVAAGGWVETNLPGFDTEALYDTTDTLIQANAPSATAQYQYAPTGCSGALASDTCTGFALNAYQEQGGTYTKNSLN